MSIAQKAQDLMFQQVAARMVPQSEADKKVIDATVAMFQNTVKEGEVGIAKVWDNHIKELFKSYDEAVKDNDQFRIDHYKDRITAAKQKAAQ